MAIHKIILDCRVGLKVLLAMTFTTGAKKARCLHGVGVEFLALDPRDNPEDDSAGSGIKT